MTDYTAWADTWGVLPEDAQTTFWRLRSDLFQAFNPPYSTRTPGRILVQPSHLQRPGATGMYLIEAMGTDLTPLPEDVRHLIANTSCQHRIELYPRTADVPRIVYYDGRAMYLGCVDAAATAGGRYRHTEGEDIQPEDRGRCRVMFRVPRDWDHVGLFAVKNDLGAWDWPSQPGSAHETWADPSQVRLARQMGWYVVVLEAYVWPNDQCLRKWGERLSRLYLRARQARADALATCYRAIVLHTIGRLHNLGYRDRHRQVELGDEEQITGGDVTVTETGYDVRDRVPFEKPDYLQHPEWSAAIWARSQYRVTKALTAVSRETILAVRGDAIYLTEPPPDTGKAGPWYDDGGVGRLRVKRDMPGPGAAPTSWDKLREIIADAPQ